MPRVMLQLQRTVVESKHEPLREMEPNLLGVLRSDNQDKRVELQAKVLQVRLGVPRGL